MNMSQKIWRAVCLIITLYPYLGAANLSPRALTSLHAAALNRHASLSTSPFPDSPATPPDSQPTSARSNADDAIAPTIARVPSGDSPNATPASTPPNPSPIRVSLLKFTRDGEEAFGSLTPDRSEQLKKMAYVEQLELEALSLSSGSSTTSAEPSPSLSTQHSSPVKSKPATPEFHRMVSDAYNQRVYNKPPSPQEPITLWQKYRQQRESKEQSLPKIPSASDIASQAKDKEPTDEKNPLAKTLTVLSMARRASGSSLPSPTSH